MGGKSSPEANGKDFQRMAFLCGPPEITVLWMRPRLAFCISSVLQNTIKQVTPLSHDTSGYWKTACSPKSLHSSRQHLVAWFLPQIMWFPSRHLGSSSSSLSIQFRTFLPKIWHLYFSRNQQIEILISPTGATYLYLYCLRLCWSFQYLQWPQ